MADSIQAIKKSENSTNEIGIITSYFSSSDVVLISGPVIEANRLVLYTKGHDVVGYYGWASQGEESYFLSGKINDNIITGKKYSLYNNSATPLKIVVSNKTARTMSPTGNINLPATKEDLFLDKKNTIYETPDTLSRVIERDYELANKGFNLVEIGGRGKTNDQYSPFNIWYRIKNERIEGWVFGLLSVF